MKAAFRRSALLLTTALLTACASAPETRVSPDTRAQTLSNLTSGSAVVAVSSCVMREGLGSRTYFEERSRGDAALMSAAMVDYLRLQGLTPSAAPIQLMCAGHEMSKSARIEDDDAPAPTPEQMPMGFTPVASGTRATLDALYAQAYDALDRRDGGAQAVAVSREALRQLQSETGASAIWLVSGSAIDISSARVTTAAVLSTVLSLGIFTEVPNSATGSFAALVDLDRGQILWTKQVGYVNAKTMNSVGNPASSINKFPTVSPRAWAASLLTPLVIPRNLPRSMESPASSAVAAAAAP
jgi:hypothetical protein